MLHFGVNCSFHLKGKKLRKRVAVTKGVAKSTNSSVYSCQHCEFKNVIPGTSKSYAKTKLTERAAHHKLSEPCQSLSACMSEKVTQPIKVITNNIVPSSALFKGSPGSSSKRTKRKGWQSLKQLCSSPVAFSPAGSKSALRINSASPSLPQSKKQDSAKFMPTDSQADLKITTSDIGGEFCIKTKSILELSEADAVSDRALDVSNSLGVAATRLCSDAEVTILTSGKVDECICLEKPLVCMTDSLQQSNASRISMIVEDKSLEEKSEIHHTEEDAAMLKQLSVPASVSKHAAQDTKSTTKAQCNLPYTVLQSDSVSVSPIPNSQGLRVNEDETCNSNSAILMEDSGIPLMVKSSIEHLDDQEKRFSTIDKELIANNSSIMKAVWRKKRKHDAAMSLERKKVANQRSMKCDFLVGTWT